MPQLTHELIDLYLRIDVPPKSEFHKDEDWVSVTFLYYEMPTKYFLLNDKLSRWVAAGKSAAWVGPEGDIGWSV